MVACLQPCPYECVRRYYFQCPDPTEAERSYAITSGSTTSKDLMFMRTKQMRGQDVRFLDTPMGESTLRDIVKRVNLRFPTEMQ